MVIIVTAILAGITVLCAIGCTGIVVYSMVSNWLSERQMYAFLIEQQKKAHEWQINKPAGSSEENRLSA